MIVSFGYGKTNYLGSISAYGYTLLNLGLVPIIDPDAIPGAILYLRKGPIELVRTCKSLVQVSG